MKGIEFPVFKTKVDGLNRRFDLNNPAERTEYFQAKARVEIEKLRKYIANGNTFISYLLGVKNSGKGTYTKLFIEALQMPDKIAHLSIGDLVRDVHMQLEDLICKQELFDFVGKNYRGPYSLNDFEESLHSRSTSSLIPSEFILSLIKFEISKNPKRCLFIDGFPRAKDQITYALFLKEMIGYRGDPDVFIFIDIAESIIDERMKSRLVCPICHAPRSLRVHPTSKIGFDEAKKEFYLMCDNPACNGVRMVSKEGDELGIEAIRERIEIDKDVIRQLYATIGISKIFLRNHIPVSVMKDTVDAYEITPFYSFERDPSTKEIQQKEQEWVVLDDEGVRSVSFLAPAVTISLIKQMVSALGL